MKKFKLFFILTIICCLLVSMVGCGKIENKHDVLINYIEKKYKKC